MHHEDIKAAVRKAGSSFAQVARELGLTTGTITSVVKHGRRSARVEKKIAEIINRPLSEIWPSRYSQEQDNEGMANS